MSLWVFRQSKIKYDEGTSEIKRIVFMILCVVISLVRSTRLLSLSGVVLGLSLVVSALALGVVVLVGVLCVHHFMILLFLELNAKLCTFPPSKFRLNSILLSACLLSVCELLPRAWHAILRVPVFGFRNSSATFPNFAATNL